VFGISFNTLVPKIFTGVFYVMY